MGYDDILKQIVGRRFEIKMFILFFVNGIPNALILTSIALIMYVPNDYRCALPEYVSEFTAENASNEEAILDFMIPPATEETEGNRSSCLIYSRTREEFFSYLRNMLRNESSLSMSPENVTALSCENHHHFEDVYQKTTAAMEFDLTCDNHWMVPIVTSALIAGITVGAVAGVLSDKFGRRPVFIIFTFFMFFMIFIQSFSTSAWMYAVMLFITGLASLVNYVCGFVLGAELTVPEKRNFLSISSFISFSITFSLSSFIWYLSPDWRWHLRICGSTGILYIANIWFTPESPRWLMAKGNVEEAKKVLRSIAKSGGVSDVTDRLMDEVEEESLRLMEEEKATKNDRGHSGMVAVFVDIFKSPYMLVIILVCSFSWFSVCLVYYGISMSIQNLSGDLLVNNTLMGLVELPGLIIAYLAVKYISRPVSHGGLMILSGVFCMGAALLSEVNPVISKVGGLIGKTANAGAFYLVFIHTAEVFPTLTRNSCMSIGSIAGRIGSITSPYFSHLGTLYGMYTPYLVMGLLTITSGLFTLFAFPDTKDMVLPQTVEDTLALPTTISKIFNGRKSKDKESTSSNTSFKDTETQI